MRTNTSFSQPNNIASTPTDVNGDGIADTAQHKLTFGDVLDTTSFNAGLNWEDALLPPQVKPTSTPSGTSARQQASVTSRSPVRDWT